MPKISRQRKLLLLKLEELIGNNCYNANIENWGPGGVFQGKGRRFRYPITFRDTAGQRVKRHDVDASMPDDMVEGGYYAFGANELHIMKGLQEALAYLEEKCGLRIPST